MILRPPKPDLRPLMEGDTITATSMSNPTLILPRHPTIDRLQRHERLLC
jgi:hypothetical protein